MKLLYLALKRLSNTTITVLVLIGIMLLSGTLIPQAYMRYMNNREFRPPFEKRLTKNIQLLDDLRDVISISEFEGALWIAYSTTSDTSLRNTLAHDKMYALRKSFPEKPIKTCIFLVDATTEQKELLEQYRADHPKLLTKDDYVIAANVRVLQKYMKNEFRFSLLPYEKEGRWIYDKDLVLVDNKLHLRGHLDFQKAIELDQAAAQEGKALTLESKVDQLFYDSVKYLLEHPDEEDPALYGEQNQDDE